MMHVYEIDLNQAQEIVNEMAKERGVRGHVIIAEYLKFRDPETKACNHFWPNQNSACYKIHEELSKLA